MHMTKLLTSQSKLKDVYSHPIGHDILAKILLQLGYSDRWITNPLVGNMKLNTFGKLTKNLLGDQFIDTLLRLLNSEKHFLPKYEGEIQQAWWKEAVVYHIYPRSFKDSDGDGIGDLRGIAEKLDYLQRLGVDIIWLSPIYDSPNDDNGYDIRNYYEIMKEFGSMDDFDHLLQETHARGMRLIMDLVVNHTSDEHPWFKDAVNNPASGYKDYYLWQQSKNGEPPNNWTSFFSGSAWNYYEQHDEWALHLFSKKQMDLNWDNSKLRHEIYKMINWWLDKGIDGFRLDVINYISKSPGLPDGDEHIGKMMRYYGIEHYFYGPRLHEYLQEMRRESFQQYDVVTVGETPGIGIEMSRLLTAQSRRELDMVFSFDHLESPGKVRFDDYKYDLNYLKSYYTEWMLNYGNDCWMSLFYENHDNPRMISKINPDPVHREAIGKLLAMLQLTLKGTPFIYQGQELGMVNVQFKSIDQLRDVESINKYKELTESMDSDAAFRQVLSGSRDHSRTPIQWSDEAWGGFTTGEPWIPMGEDYLHCNVQSAEQNSNSVLSFYKQLIALRKSEKALVYGEFVPVSLKKRDVFSYYRKLGGEAFYIELNLSNKAQRKPINTASYSHLMGSSSHLSQQLQPYECNIYKC